MRPCRGGRAGEAWCACSSTKVWSSQGSEVGAGRDKARLNKDEFQPDGGVLGSPCREGAEQLIQGPLGVGGMGTVRDGKGGSPDSGETGWVHSQPLTEPFGCASVFSSVKWADHAELRFMGLRGADEMIWIKGLELI